MTLTRPAWRLERPATVPCLGEVTALLDLLHDGGIRYCHWKSNQHLRASLLGETDLDVLVSRDDVQPLTRILGATSFKQCRTVSFRGYPGIESYIGLDRQTGRLLHLHLHYQLTVGERHLKGYRLPWEQVLLSTRTLSRAEGIYVADPHLELLLLVLRAALKLRWRDLVLTRSGSSPLHANGLREFRWLAARTEPGRLASLAGPLVGEAAAALLGEMARGSPPSPRDLRRLRRSIEPAPEEYRTYPALEAGCRRWYRALLSRRAARRRLPQGGVIIAVLGADGSGKSTLTTELARWLQGQLDTTRIYFGSGQGPASLPRRALEAVASLVKRVGRSARAAAPPTRRGQSSSAGRRLGEMLWISLLAVERRRRAARARRARNQGLIVLCDRFPQSQFPGNEGPWLGHWLRDRSRLRRIVAHQELGAIRCAERLRPDLVVKLNVTPHVALHRKPETPSALLHAKLRLLEQLRFPEGTRVIEVDATRPLEQVVLEVKRHVWSAL